MSSFHSTVTRRDFMKGLGMTGAAIGAAGMVAPVYHDLDEVMSSPDAKVKRPWWIKQREHDDPSAEVDWSALKRYDHKNRPRYNTFATAEQLAKDSAAAKAIWDNSKVTDVPGNTLKDQLLAAADGFRAINGWGYDDIVSQGAAKVKTFTDFGVPKWTGTPEEATAMLRSAVIFYGAVSISPGGLNGKHRNLVNLSDRSRDIEFQTLPTGDEGGLRSNKYVIPDIPLWEFGFQIPQSSEMWTTGRTMLWKAANGSRYRVRYNSVQPCTQRFLKGLGYMGIGGSGYPISSGPGSAILHGQAEASRNPWNAISPQFGSTHGYFELMTDLELEDDPPIDAGIFRFCKTCGICADACPSGSLSHAKEPSWEIPPQSLVPDRPGIGHAWKKMYWSDRSLCEQLYGMNCCICYASCVFNSGNGAIIHSIVKQTLSATPLFNSFFATMHGPFGYEMGGADTWWERSLPTWGWDSTLLATDVNSRK